MAWVKVPPENHPLFHAALPDDARVETVQMFGGVAAKVNGNLFAGLFGRSTMLLLVEPDRTAALRLEGASLFDPMGNGRVRSDKIMLPERVMREPAELRQWIARAFDAAVLLPNKATKGVPALKSAKPTRTPRAQEARSPEEENAGSLAFAKVVKALVRGDASVEGPKTGRREFGSDALKVKGKIFAMLVRGRLVLKLPRSRVEALIDADRGTAFDAGKGKAMKEWVVIRAPEANWVALAREARAHVEQSATKGR